MGSFTCITQHTGPTALRPVRRTKQLWLSVLLTDTDAATGQAGIRTHILTTPALDCSTTILLKMSCRIYINLPSGNFLQNRHKIMYTKKCNSFWTFSQQTWAPVLIKYSQVSFMIFFLKIEGWKEGMLTIPFKFFLSLLLFVISRWFRLQFDCSPRGQVSQGIWWPVPYADVHNWHGGKSRCFGCKKGT